MKYLTFEVECLCLMPNNVGAYNMAIAAASTVLKIPLVIYGSVELAISLYFPKTFNFSNFDSTDDAHSGCNSRSDGTPSNSRQMPAVSKPPAFDRRFQVLPMCNRVFQNYHLIH